MKKFVALLPPVLVLAGCAGTTTRSTPIEILSDMHRQLKYTPQEASSFFKDGRASRPPVPGTVAVGEAKLDDVFYTGRINDNTYAGQNPLPLNRETFARGQERFNIYCAPCHDRTGSGHGMVPNRTPSWLPANLLDQRIRKMADGELFSIISHGKRSMPAYRFQIEEKDRWAIVAYVRALQRAASGSVADVPLELRPDLR